MKWSWPQSQTLPPRQRERATVAAQFLPCGPGTCLHRRGGNVQKLWISAAEFLYAGDAPAAVESESGWDRLRTLDSQTAEGRQRNVITTHFTLDCWGLVLKCTSSYIHKRSEISIIRMIAFRCSLILSNCNTRLQVDRYSLITIKNWSEEAFLRGLKWLFCFPYTDYCAYSKEINKC